MSSATILRLEWAFYEACLQCYDGRMLGPDDEWVSMYCGGGEL
jgi:hypothetical protein